MHISSLFHLVFTIYVSISCPLVCLVFGLSQQRIGDDDESNEFSMTQNDVDEGNSKRELITMEPMRKNQGNNNNNLHFDSVCVLSIFDSYETTAVTAVATAAAAAKEKEVQYFLTCARWLAG